jgi:hypothetical protein
MEVTREDPDYFFLKTARFLCCAHARSAGPREDLQLILFVTVIVLQMVGGTLVVLFNPRPRMM